MLDSGLRQGEDVPQGLGWPDLDLPVPRLRDIRWTIRIYNDQRARKVPTRRGHRQSSRG